MQIRIGSVHRNRFDCIGVHQIRSIMHWIWYRQEIFGDMWRKNTKYYLKLIILLLRITTIKKSSVHLYYNVDVSIFHHQDKRLRKYYSDISFSIELICDSFKPSPIFESLLETILPLKNAINVGTVLIENLSHKGLSSSLMVLA